ncbi:hypothetical protein C8A01DRAFT_48993 [Parachaetomium inaequale]|uniref:Uncharacterized protein n=1 Tax=Parachaetomium inaequale TaxID=2588326 RepID=A0AAN6PBZ1_9PEZI|nr:hypothetical protein C8A01DRAFT_48993 [Parachaetomium inaequale]
MIRQVESRLVVVTVFLLLQFAVFLIELLIFDTRVKTQKWYTPPRQWLTPLVAALVGIILVSVTFSGPSRGMDLEFDSSRCSTDIDSDIAGVGVRIAVWVQVSVLILISILGSLHSKATGAKEVGAGLVLTHVSLAIALVVQISRGTLSLADAATGAMIMDAQNIALSIQLVAKEALAARWQVGIVITSQIFGLAVLPVLITKLSDGSLASDECSCLTVFWWARISNCFVVSPTERAIFWIYYACRCAGFSQTAFHSIYNTRAFHLAEPKGNSSTQDEEDGGFLDNITYPHFSAQGPARYGTYPATVSLMYALYGLLAFTSLLAAEMAIRDLGLHPSSAVDSVGQIIALVIAGATALRAAWLFGNLFVHEIKGKKRPNFQNPFKLQLLSKYNSYAAWIRLPNFTTTPDMLPLGTILRDPTDIDSAIHHLTHHYEFNSRAARGRGFAEESIAIETLESKKMTKIHGFIHEIMRKPDLADSVGSLNTGLRRVRLYVVTGVLIARGARVYRYQGLGVQPQVTQGQLLASVDLGVPVEVFAQLAQERGSHEVETWTPQSDFLFAYRLHEVTFSRKRDRVSKIMLHTKGADVIL